MVIGVVVLVRGDRELARWPLQLAASTVDLGAVEHLARAQLAAKRLGCELRLDEPCARVRELLDLAGLAHWVEVGR